MVTVSALRQAQGTEWGLRERNGLEGTEWGSREPAGRGLAGQALHHGAVEARQSRGQRHDRPAQR